MTANSGQAKNKVCGTGENKGMIMRIKLFSGVAAAVLALIVTLTSVASVQAGPAEDELLQGFVGNWRGNSVLTGGDEPEEFTCRMTIADGNGSRINFAGRCSLIGINLAVNGTVAYIDENRRYEGAMTSNTAYSGLAVGRQQGDRIIFNFQRRNLSDAGQDLTVGSTIILDGDHITVEFIVTFNESGDTMEATVPFGRS